MMNINIPLIKKHYKHRVDDWVVFDNSGKIPLILGEKA
jgi:hypothetical protein